LKIILDEKDIIELIKKNYTNAEKVTFNSKKGEITAIIQTDKIVSVASPKPVMTEKPDNTMTGEGRERRLINLG